MYKNEEWLSGKLLKGKPRLCRQFRSKRTRTAGSGNDPLDAGAFLFHPDQTVEAHEDGTLTVRFTADGFDEMCWRLVTWGESVTVEKPVR